MLKPVFFFLISKYFWRLWYCKDVMEIFRSLIVKWHFYTPIAGHHAPQSAGPKPIPNPFGGFDDFTKS